MDLEQLKAKLKAQKLGVGVEQLGNRLYLSATLPPKPGTNKPRPFQQRIALGVYANPAGFKRAEAEARTLSGMLASNRFDWSMYLKTEPESAQPKTYPVAYWVERFHEDYFSRRALTQASATTWRTNFHQVFIQIDPTEQLTAELIRGAVLGTGADTRTRLKFCASLGALARFAALTVGGVAGKL